METLHLVRDKTSQSFARVFADLTAQLPPEEMKTRTAMSSLLSSGRYHLLHAYDAQEWVGYLIVYYDQLSRSLWMDYLAVFSDFHSRGYGGRMMALLPSLYPEASGCYIEVQKESNADPSTLRRIRFYEKQGAQRLHLDYLYPCVEGTFPMHLFFVPYTARAREGLSAEQVFGTIQRVFHNIHPDIPHIERVLKKIRRNLKLRAGACTRLP